MVRRRRLEGNARSPHGQESNSAECGVMGAAQGLRFIRSSRTWTLSAWIFPLPKVSEKRKDSWSGREDSNLRPRKPHLYQNPCHYRVSTSYSGETRRDTANNRTFCTLYAPCSLFSEPLALFCVNKVEAERRSLSIKHLNLISRFHSWQNKKREQGTGSHRIEPMQ